MKLHRVILSGAMLALLSDFGMAASTGARPVDRDAQGHPLRSPTQNASGDQATPPTAADLATRAKTGEDGIYRKSGSDGSIELSNLPDDADYEKLPIDAPAASVGAPEFAYGMRFPSYAQPASASIGTPDAMPAAPAPDPSGDATSTADGGTTGALKSEAPATFGGYADMAAGNPAMAPSTQGTGTAGGPRYVAGGGPPGVPATTPMPAPHSAPPPAVPGPQTPVQWPGSIPPQDVKDPFLAQMLPTIGPALLASGNPAIGRRYLMLDRNTYLNLYGGK